MDLAPVAHPTAVLDSQRIMVRPVHQSAEIIPFVHATEMDPVAERQRYPVGKIDVVSNQERLAIAQLDDKALMLRSIVIIRQQAPDETRVFDPDYDVRLVSFAVHWIRAEIHEFVLKNWRIVKVATTKAQRKLFFNLRKKKKTLAWLSAKETAAVADDLGVSVKEVTEMEKRLHSRDTIFDPAPDADDEKNFTPAASLPAPDADPAKQVETADFNSDATTRMTAALKILDDRARHIIEARWLTDDKKTLHELAAVYGVSAERIRQLEANAIKKMRNAMAV